MLLLGANHAGHLTAVELRTVTQPLAVEVTYVFGAMKGPYKYLVGQMEGTFCRSVKMLEQADFA